MTYGYIRVSTDRQNVENQRFEINNYCLKKGIVIDNWIEETISGTKSPSRRRLGVLLQKVNKGDKIICSELSRLGRSLLMIMSILNILMEKGVVVYTIKDNYVLGDDIQSKVLAFAFGLSAEIERNLISQRTKEALERKKAEGQKLGRPKGSTTETSKLDGAEIGATIMLMQGISVNQMAKLYGVHRNTVKKFITSKKLGSRENIERMLKLIG